MTELKGGGSMSVPVRLATMRVPTLGAILVLVLLGLGCLSSGTARAEEQEPDAAAIPTPEQARDILNSYQRPADLAVPDTSTGVKFDATTSAAEQAAWQEYFAYRIDGYKHRQSVFEWQWLSSKVIFIVVLLLVFLGMYFAAIQFHVGLRRGSSPASTDKTAAKTGSEATELELSLKGVKVRSEVLGVIILALSLAFFYLYLVFVYPIQDVF